MVQGLVGRAGPGGRAPRLLLRRTAGAGPAAGTAGPDGAFPATGGEPPVGGTSAASPSASFDTSSAAGPSATADDPFGDPLGGDWPTARSGPPSIPTSRRTAPASPGAGGGSAGATGDAAPAMPAAGLDGRVVFGPVCAAVPAFGGPSSPAAPSLAPAAATPAAATPAALSAASTPAAGAAGNAAPAASAAAFLQAYGRTQLAFEPNLGQTDPSVDFLFARAGLRGRSQPTAAPSWSLAPPAAATQPGQARRPLHGTPPTC